MYVPSRALATTDPARSTCARPLYGYLPGAGVVVVGGVVAAVLGVAAEQKSLEDVATPMSARRRPGTRAEGAARP